MLLKRQTGEYPVATIRRAPTMKSTPLPCVDHSYKDVSKEDAGRVEYLIRNRIHISHWSDDDKQLFVNVSNRASTYGTFVINKVLAPLDTDEMQSLLRAWYANYRESPSVFIKWFSAEKSFDAMCTSGVSPGELRIYIEEVFGGRDEWLSALLFLSKNAIMRAIQSPDVFAVLFPDDLIPLNFMERFLAFSTTMKTNYYLVESGKLFDLVVHSARHYLKMGGVTARIVQDAVITFVSRTAEAPGYTVLTSIYSEPVLITDSESWTKLIFGRLDGCMCNTDFDDWRNADDDGVEIHEIPFCCACCDFYEEVDLGLSCTCDDKLYPTICKFLMKKGVQIPDEFWERCAYHNLWHFAHYLHTYRPESFPMNIPIGAFKKALRYDRIGFAKFLVQYKYFSLSDVPRDAQISTKMREMLGVGTKKQRRDEIMTAQSVLDEFKQDMPENTYIELCKRYKDCFD